MPLRFGMPMGECWLAVSDDNSTRIHGSSNPAVVDVKTGALNREEFRARMCPPRCSAKVVGLDCCRRDASDDAERAGGIG